ncbi:hypothetical protein ACTJKB_30770 [Paenibacillus sp. 22594]
MPCPAELEWISGGDLSGVYGCKLGFAEGVLYIVVSEYAWDADVEVQGPQNGMSYSFRLEKERSILFAADKQGQLTSVYRAGETAITTH